MKQLLCLFCLFKVLSSVTHWVLQDNHIYIKERSEYDLREFSSIQKVLEQDDLVRNANAILDKLDHVKQGIIDDAPLLNTEEPIGEKDCLEAGLLSDFDFSILPALEKEHGGSSRFEQYMCTCDVPKNLPDCSLTEDTFHMGDYRHIPGVQYILEEQGSPLYSLLPFIPTDDIALFGHCLHKHILQNSTNWHVYFGASFYWRLQGNDVAALECTFKSLYYAGNNRDYLDGPLVTLGNLLSTAGFDSDAALVMEHSAMTPYLQQLKLWSAGNLYTLSEQYKLSLDLYNKTLQLGPFPLADQRLQTMECYSSVIQRMEKQNNILRSTLQKLRERHELETKYIGLQEKMFSNLNNETLPEHIILQITNTEEAVTNTHKLVTEQQEIQNTLSPTKFQFPASHDGDDLDILVDDLQVLLEQTKPKKQARLVDVKKDIHWIRSTRLKLEDLVKHIRVQLSDPTVVPIEYEDEEQDTRKEGGSGDALDEEEVEGMFDMDTDTEVIPPPDHINQASVESLKGRYLEGQLTVTIGHVSSKECGAGEGAQEHWAALKCKITSDIKKKLDKEVKIFIRDQTDNSATIELVSDDNPEMLLPHVQNAILNEEELARLKVKAFTSPPRRLEVERPDVDEATLVKLVTANLNTRDIDETMRQIRVSNVKPYKNDIADAVKLNFGENHWILRFHKIDSTPNRMIMLEQCDEYTPIFTHSDPYVPLLVPLAAHGLTIPPSLLLSPDTLNPMSPDCTTHMSLDNCLLCYDDLLSVQNSYHEPRNMLVPFTLLEIEHLVEDVHMLGAVLDHTLRENPSNWLLYYLSALYHRSYTHNLGPAIQCTRRALALVEQQYRAIPLLTLANLLHQAQRIPDALKIVLELLETDPNQYLHHIEAAVLQVAIGKADGIYRAALDVLRLSHSPVADQLLNSLLCYYDIHKQPHKPPFAKRIVSKAITHDKKHPPFYKGNKASIDGEVWRLEHHEGISVDVTWVSGELRNQ